MRESFWRNLVGAAVVVVWIATVLLVFTSGWDALVHEVYGWWDRMPGRFAVSDLAKIIVLASVSGGALYFFGADPAREFWKNRARANEARVRGSVKPSPERQSTKTPMPSSNHCVDFDGLIERAGRWQSEHSGSDRPKNAFVAQKFYDALQNGHLMAWGRPSSVFPPDALPPYPKQESIGQSFWSDHLLEEMEMISGRVSPKKKQSGQPWHSITLAPASKFKRRALAPCYWDLVFDEAGARKLYPLRNDWMSA